MAKRRDDILERVRELIAPLTDGEILQELHEPQSDDPAARWRATEEQWTIRKTLSKIEQQMVDEFACQRSTVRSQIGTALRERRKNMDSKNGK